MLCFKNPLLSSLILVLAAWSAGGCAARRSDSAAARQAFLAPTREYSSSPLWVWNDDLTEQEVLDTLRDLAGQHVRQVFVHPRPGLMTPYLSEKWMQLWKATLREAERLDMNVWIYDENSYPSGFAGGHVPELMPEACGKGLFFHASDSVPAWKKETVAVYRITGETYGNVSEKASRSEKLPAGKYVAAEIQIAPRQPWHGGRSYVDLLHPGVTQKFLEVTHDAYKHAFGEQFGKRVPGSFTDEPHILPAGGLPWTPDLPAQFKKRWGYELTDHLICLSRPVGDYRKVRHHYFETLRDLFVERWAKPYGDYCEKNHLELTGHYWEHDWPIGLRVPDNMAMYGWHQRPAIDILMNQYNEDVHAQFGNVRSVKELASVANQLGKQRTLCEAYGAGGWDMRFEDMKRIGDWLYVLGVNTLDQHLSYITIRGARKHDHPQSFSYHEPWWNEYHVLADYFTRLSAAMSQGREINRILLIEPTTTAWMYNTEACDDSKLKQLGDTFQKVVTDLAKHQVEFDIGSEDLIARYGSVRGGLLVVGQREYEMVIVPPMTENLDSKTLDLLESFSRTTSGTLICSGGVPNRVDGIVSDRPKTIAREASWRIVEPSTFIETVWRASHELPLEKNFSDRRADVEMASDSKGILFHQRRQLADGQLLLLVNTSIDAQALGTVTTRTDAIEQWDPQTGHIWSYPSEEKGSGTFSRNGPEGASQKRYLTPFLRLHNVTFRLPPCGSLLLHIADAGGKSTAPPAPPTWHTGEQVAPSAPLKVRRAAANVLTLDYVDITAGGETRKDVYVLKAAEFAFKKNGVDRNPWDRAVQYKDELLSRTFDRNSGFEATYHFKIEGGVPADLAIVIERPDLYMVSCNGQEVKADKNWWLDRSFGKLDIHSTAKPGENFVTIKASPMTMFHELEAAYVVGGFSLKPVDKGFLIIGEEKGSGSFSRNGPEGASQKMNLTPFLRPWNEQGLPLYAAGVSYQQAYRLEKFGGRYAVSLPDWRGSIARVIVNGQEAGSIWRQPWECDVTDRLKVGDNTIEVIVIGTLKNTLGPHHGKPPLGMAWPGMWDNAPEHGPPAGKEYSTVGYGLFEPFVLSRLP